MLGKDNFPRAGTNIAALSLRLRVPLLLTRLFFCGILNIAARVGLKRKAERSRLFRLPRRVYGTKFVRKVRLFVYAIIETGGKQVKVSEGDVIFVERLPASEGDEVTFDRVLAVGEGEGLRVGAPTVEGARVKASVVKNGRAKKITVFRYKAKKNEKRKLGHRQPYTRVQITSIEA